MPTSGELRVDRIEGGWALVGYDGREWRRIRAFVGDWFDAMSAEKAEELALYWFWAPFRLGVTPRIG